MVRAWERNSSWAAAFFFEIDACQHTTRLFDEAIWEWPYRRRSNSVGCKGRRIPGTAGASGCGKSTVLRMIAGLESPSSGRILIDDACVNSWPPQRRNLAMVFQDYALYPHLTVEQNLAFGLKMRKTPRQQIASRVAEVASLMGLANVLNHRPNQLSGGQQQRVALGRALVRQPHVFLLDEPLSNVDAQLRLELRRELAMLHQRRPTTTVYVTHDQVEAMTLGQRIAVMRAGKIQQVGTPTDIYIRPANTFVAEFMGCPPMNLVEGRISGACFSTDEFEIPVPQALSDGNATMGIRAEHIRLGEADFSVLATLELVEYLGHEILATFRFGHQRWAVRLGGEWRAPLGSEHSLAVSAGDILWFDEAGSRITSR